VRRASIATFLIAAAIAMPLIGCGGGDDETTTGGRTGPTETTLGTEGGLEPELGVGYRLCGDIQDNSGKFVAFRVFAKEASCDTTEAVVRGALRDSPPQGWSCETKGDADFSLTTCMKGGAEVGFNEE
jgi:hypothetical protein